MTFLDLPVRLLPLVDAVLKATAILAAAAGASLLLRRRPAALRHLVWTLAIGAVLILPVLTFALPRWRLPLVEMPAAAATAAVVPPAVHDVPALPLGHAPAVDDDAPATTHAARARAEATLAERGRWWTRVDLSATTIALAIWGAGAAVVGARILIGFLTVSWLARRAAEAHDAPWLPLANTLARELGVTPRLRFLRSARASMPIAAGIFRPAVILPADADTWPEARLRVVLLHELAHVRRRDCLTHLLAQAACAIYWFNPLAWLAVRRLRQERERACDDLVLARGTRSSEYADELLQIARSLQRDRLAGIAASASLAMARRSQLEGRLMAILDPHVPRVGVSRAAAVAAVVFTCAAVAPLGALQPWTTAAPVAGTEAPSPARPAPSAHQQSGLPGDPQTPSPAPTPTPTPTPDPSPAIAPVVTPRVAVKAPSVRFDFDMDMDAIADSPVKHVAPHIGRAVEGALAAAAEGKHQEAKARDPKAVAALAAALRDSDAKVREAALQALVQLRDPAVFEPLTQALKDGSPHVREQAAFGLGQLRDRRATPALVVALKDSHADVREQAAFALAQMRDPAAVEALGAATRDEHRGVREQAIFALGQIRDPRAVEPLAGALKDTNPDVREQAAFALGQLRDRSAVDPLIVALKDSNAEVREQIVFALGQLRDPRAIDALTQALKDENAEVRQQAAFALGQVVR